MGVDACVANGIDDADFESACNSLSDGVAICENGVNMIDPTKFMELLTLLDLDLAYFSEKMVNLDLYMTIVSLGEIGLGELSVQNRNISEVEIQKALIFDLSLGYLDSEITVLGSFLKVLQAQIIDAHQKICSFKQRKEIFSIFHGKLQASEDSWKHLQEQLSELKRQLANFKKTLSLSGKKTTYSTENEDLERSHYDMQIAGQQRLVLKMLEKSLAAELKLEKQLLASRKREEELESKLLLTNEAVSGTEAFLGVALERLLEVEHSSQVFMGIAKEIMSRLQINEFNMHCSILREEELNSKLEHSLEQLKEREKLEHELKELRKKLQDSESKVQELNASYEASLEQLSEMEIATESLREHALIAETRAHDAEEKLATVTEENIELREEVGFLKVGDEEKISLLEKQVRDLEVKLKTSKSSAEASQEQQNMLYTAIWDMETLIEELKSKVSKSESRAENADGKCLALAETNIGLNKEIGSLKTENGKLEESLKEAKKMKVERAKDINNGAKLITEMVMKLAIERERVQKQLSSLLRENTILLEELRRMRKSVIEANSGNKEADTNNTSAIDNAVAGVSPALSSIEELVETPTSATASNQVEEPSEENSSDEAEGASSSRFDNGAVAANCTNHDIAKAADSLSSDDAVVANFANHENATSRDHESISSRLKNKRHIGRKSYIFAAIFILLFSILAMHINWQDIYLIMRRQYLDFQ